VCIKADVVLEKKKESQAWMLFIPSPYAIGLFFKQTVPFSLSLLPDGNGIYRQIE